MEQVQQIDKRLVAVEAILPTLATKADLARLQLSTKEDLAQLRVDFERGLKENRSWMIATVLGMVLAMLAIGNFIASSLASQIAHAIGAQ